MYPKLIPQAVRDNYDDENLSDIDDEVFIRDGTSGILKIDEDCADKRPLMPPRRKAKNPYNMDRYAMPYKTLFAPFCYGILALVILIVLILLGIFTINVIFPMPVNLVRNWFFRKSNVEPVINISREIVACTFLTHEVVWKKTLPKFAAEAPLRKNDVNGDNVEDIIVGFSVGLDLYDSLPEYVCEVYFEKQAPCLGGVSALNGINGETLWTHWTAHAIFSVDCDIDLTSDGTKDCVISGRGAILHAINGRDGTTIWEVEKKFASEVLDVYDAKFVSDLDGDGVGDVVASHIIQSDQTRNSRIIILSGATGAEIQSVDLPESEQLFVAPQILTQSDGGNVFILATNSKKKTGGLYAVPESMILRGEMKLRKLHHGPGKGVSLPPILADITSDGTEDIIAAMFSSTVIAYDGVTFRQLWNYTVPDSEIISIPVPGYYNDDDIPDFLVKHQLGPGFPVYYYTLATILDGKTGKPLLEKPMEDSMSAQMSGLSITVDGFGNDWFLHWSADCLNHEGDRAKYRFVNEEITSESGADLCKLRFNSTLVTKLFALSQHVEPPGVELYSSEKWKKVEFASFSDPREEAERVIQQKTEQQMKMIKKKPQEPTKYYPRERDDQYESELGKEQKEGEEEIEMSENWRDPYKNYDNYDDAELPEMSPPRALDKGSLEELQMKRRELPKTENLKRVKKQSVTQKPTETTMSEDMLIGRIFKKQSMSQFLLRSKRDEELMRGVQRQPPTGILVAPLKERVKGEGQAVDLIFSTYWLPASEVPFVLLQQDIECIQNQKAQLVNEPEKSDEEKIVRECLAARGVDYRLYQEATDKENTNVALGQMTVYRISIRCGCPEDMLAGQSCRNISSTQSWPAHLGINANGYFKPARHQN